MSANAVRKPQTERVATERLGDNELVERYLAGESRRFQELVERYEGRMVNFIQRSIGDRDRAEDLAQEVFVRVYRHIRRFDTSKKFSTWIYTIASNLAKNELRNRSRNPLVLFQTIKKNWEAAIDVRLQFGPVTAVWNCEIGKVNTFQHIWPYKTLDQREEIRKKAQATGLWPAGKKAIKEGGRDYELVSQENKIVMPSAFSPLQ